MLTALVVVSCASLGAPATSDYSSVKRGAYKETVAAASRAALMQGSEQGVPAADARREHIVSSQGREGTRVGLPSATKYPLLLLPGFTGSSLESKLTNKRTIWPQCPKSTDGEWPILWLDLSQFEPPELAVCFIENMKINVVNGELHNHPGVEIRPRDWGGVEGLMYQDSQKRIPSYYKQFVETMERNGWKRGETLFGAPYDWRYASERIDDHYDKMKALIEKIHSDTGLPVSIYGHSMGPTVGLEFLHKMPQAWKDEHIAVFLASAPVWSGNVVSVWSAISGLDCIAAFGVPCPGAEAGLGRALLRDVADSMPASYATFAQPGEDNPSLWSRDEVLIKTPSKSYSAYDMQEMLTDLGLTDGAEVQKFVAAGIARSTFTAPLVDTHVFYGYGVPTPTLFEYAADFSPLKLGEAPPMESRIDRNPDDYGDGVVPLRSTTRTNATWPAEQEKAGKVLTQKGFLGMAHTNTEATMADVIKILNGLPNDPRYIARLESEAAALQERE